MARELFGESFGIPVGILGRNLELTANPISYDTGQRRSPVRGLPNDGRNITQGEEGRIRRRHDDHFVI